jgi:hypothetical protein
MNYQSIKEEKITKEQAIELLSYIDQRPDHYTWIRVISAIANSFDEATALEILHSRFTDERPNEHAYMIHHCLDQYKIGSLIYYAEENGAILKDILHFDPNAPRKRKVIKPKPKPKHKIEPENVLYTSRPPRPTERLYRIAINKTIFNKNLRPVSKKPYSNYWNLTTQFKNVNVTLDEFIDNVRSGYAFLCSQLTDETSRCNKNFKHAEVFALDIDHGLTIDAALQMDTTNHALFIYTTANHTTEKPRFRIVFDLPGLITDPITYNAIINNFIAIYGGDPNAKDQTRAFYGFDQTTIINVRSGDQI